MRFTARRIDSLSIFEPRHTIEFSWRGRKRRVTIMFTQDKDGQPWWLHVTINTYAPIRTRGLIHVILNWREARRWHHAHMWQRRHRPKF